MTSEEYAEVDEARRRLHDFWRDVTKAYTDSNIGKGLAVAGKDFFSDSRWLREGTSFRQLVEPLDIANWYKIGIHLPEKGIQYSGHYLDQVQKGDTGKRPGAFQVLQAAVQRPQSPIADVDSIAKAREYEAKALANALKVQTVEDARAKPPRGFTRSSGAPTAPDKGSLPARWTYDVFISHAGEIKPLADELHNELKQLGLRPFLDKRDLVPGDVADPIMESAAATAPIGLVLIDPHFLHKTWPVKEFSIIVQRGTLVPVLIGMSYEDFRSSLRMSNRTLDLGDAFIREVERITYRVNSVEDLKNLIEMRQRIELDVARAYIEKVCPKLQNTMKGAEYLRKGDVLLENVVSKLGKLPYEIIEDVKRKWQVELNAVRSNFEN